MITNREEIREAESKINQTALQTVYTLPTTFIQPQIINSILYPLSGADITPLVLFPNAHTYLMIDEHPLFNLTVAF